MSQKISQIEDLLASILHDIEKYFNYLIGNDISTLLEEKSKIFYDYLDDTRIKIGNECIYISNEQLNDIITDTFEPYEINEPELTEFSKNLDEIVKSECFSNAEIHTKESKIKNLRVLIEYLPLEPRILSGNLQNVVAKTPAKIAENILKIDIDPVILSTNDLMIQECYKRRVLIVLEKLPFFTDKGFETQRIKTEAQDSETNLDENGILKTKKVTRKKSHSAKKYRCTKCEIPRYFDRPSCLEFHEKRSHIKKEKPFKCRFENCTQSFYTNASYTNHKNVKHSNCSKCPEKFTTRIDLRNHLKSSHKNNPEIFFKCSKCPKSFLSWSGRKDHFQKFHEIFPNTSDKVSCEFQNCTKVLKKMNVVDCEFHKLTHEIKDFNLLFWDQKMCPVCRKSFKNYALRKNHLINMHYSSILRKHVCKFCDKVYKRRCELKYHEMRHLATKDNFPCSTCNLKFSSKIHLKSHIRYKHEEHKCRWANCDAIFVGLNSYKNHLKEHDEKYICHYCPKVYDFKGELNAHIGRVHREFKCDFKGCKEIFNTEEKLLKHGVFHDREKKPQILCVKCGKNYWTEKTLKMHVTQSHGSKVKKKYGKKCSIEGCDQICFTNSHLEIHEKFHRKQLEKQKALQNYTGPKYECDQCDKVYTQSQSLRFHVKSTHLNKREFACDFENCDKRFNTKKNLNTHRESHLAKKEDKKLFCKFCDKIYSTKDLMNRHMRKSHKEKLDYLPFKCTHPDCGQSFFRNKFLQTHLETEHTSK